MMAPVTSGTRASRRRSRGRVRAARPARRHRLRGRTPSRPTAQRRRSFRPCCGSSRSVSRTPGPPPRTSIAAITGRSNRTAVTPEATLSSSAWPTVTPVTSVRRFFIQRPNRNEMIAASAGRQPFHRRRSHRGDGWPCGLAMASGYVASSRMIHDVSIVAALLAGLVSFLSPCVLPLVPPYLVYLAGDLGRQRAAGEAPAPSRRMRAERVGAAVRARLLHRVRGARRERRTVGAAVLQAAWPGRRSRIGSPASPSSSWGCNFLGVIADPAS